VAAVVNGEIEVQKLVDPAFQIWFGSLGQATGADAFAAVVTEYRAEHPGLTYLDSHPGTAGSRRDRPAAVRRGVRWFRCGR
jgi:hypothetical protein